MVKQFLEDEGLKIGDIIHALRVAVTGKSVGLGMFDALEILGRDETLARIDRRSKCSKMTTNQNITTRRRDGGPDRAGATVPTDRGR